MNRKDSAKREAKSKKNSPGSSGKGRKAIQGPKTMHASPSPLTQRRKAERKSQPGTLTPSPLSGVREVHSTAANQISDDFTALRIVAEMFSDVQQLRIASVNRAERGGIDKETFAGLLSALEAQEKAVANQLRDEYRRVVPSEIREWQANAKGLGEHIVARLLGHLGHPAMAHPCQWSGSGVTRKLVRLPSYQRSIGQLWAYCGVGDPTRKRRRGEDGAACGSPRLRSLLYVMAEGCMKQKGGYRQVYDEARAVYETREGWPKGRIHAAALRKVAKEILRDLWIITPKEYA